MIALGVSMMFQRIITKFDRHSGNPATAGSDRIQELSRIAQFKVTRRSCGKPSGANAMGQRLVATFNLQCCSGLPRKLPARPSTLDGIEMIRFCAFAPPGSPLERHTGAISAAESGIIVAPYGIRPFWILGFTGTVC
jgi:hypothetical protein